VSPGAGARPRGPRSWHDSGSFGRGAAVLGSRIRGDGAGVAAGSGPAASTTGRGISSASCGLGRLRRLVGRARNRRHRRLLRRDDCHVQPGRGSARPDAACDGLRRCCCTAGSAVCPSLASGHVSELPQGRGVISPQKPPCGGFSHDHEPAKPSQPTTGTTDTPSSRAGRLAPEPAATPAPSPRILLPKTAAPPAEAPTVVPRIEALGPRAGACDTRPCPHPSRPRIVDESRSRWRTPRLSATGSSLDGPRREFRARTPEPGEPSAREDAGYAKVTIEPTPRPARDRLRPQAVKAAYLTYFGINDRRIRGRVLT